jgi:D-alanyl-lipoteichoic acid acyltransferase DltB (MBOAT superfamily)
MLGAFLFAFQIYADFSGYSDMAIGVALLMGINVTKNFNYPFFSQNIADFWRRWHISLTSWLTEYVFTPLSITFRDWGNKGLIVAIVINFTIIGLWHGANWTYVLFGFLHGCYFIPLILRGTMNKKKQVAQNRILPTFTEFTNIIKTFIIVMLTFVIFRSVSITDAYLYFTKMISVSLFTIPNIPNHNLNILLTLIFIASMISIEWLGKNKPFALSDLQIIFSKSIRFACYIFIILIISLFGYHYETIEFIYFQF